MNPDDDSTVMAASFFGIPIHVSPAVPRGIAFLVDWGDQPLFDLREPPKLDEHLDGEDITIRWAAMLAQPRAVVPLVGAWLESEAMPRQTRRPKYGRGGRRKRARRNGRARG